jgi:hypothetical protein
MENLLMKKNQKNQAHLVLLGKDRMLVDFRAHGLHNKKFNKND